MIFVVISTLACVSAVDNSTVDMQQDNQMLYVDSTVGENGNGSEMSPFSSISVAVDSAGNNSHVILKNGIYKGSSNTGIVIDKDLTIESFDGGVTIDGENKNAFFKINSGCRLILNNIKFANAYAKDYIQLGAINNKGNLTIINSSFIKMNTVMGAIYNEGELCIQNSKMSDSTSKNMAQLITNIGNCTIINSQVLDNPYKSSGVENGVYNFNILKILSSQVTLINSNNQFDEDSFKQAKISIVNSTISDLDVDGAVVNIFNSKFSGRNRFNNVNVTISESSFAKDISILPVFNSNFTAIHSIFDVDISSGASNLNITYSAILGSISGGGLLGSLYAPYNWWGLNRGPAISYFKNYNTSLWAIASFEYPADEIPINPSQEFTVSLNKWCDGNNIYEFGVNEYIPQRTVSFESQNGKFMYSSLKINGSVNNYLVDNTLDSNVFAIIDSQRLTLTIGKGLSQYTYFVSPDGHDGPEDGSYEKPFLTLAYAFSKAGNGNTICMLPGLHKNIANCGLSIEKDLTVVGLGDNVVLQRANSYNIFDVKSWGSLCIKNIKFTVVDRAYSDVLIVVSGGKLDVINCSFTSISVPEVIYASGFAKVNIVDSIFSDIIGSAVSGNPVLTVNNSIFEKFSAFYHRSGVESYNCLFPVTKSIEIYNSLFRNNVMGIVNLRPMTYSSSPLLGATISDGVSYDVYAYIENSTFVGNVFREMNNYYSSNGIGLQIWEIHDSFHGFVNNCSFIDNEGSILIADSVNNSRFINNSGKSSGGGIFVKASLINNSLFMGNVNLYREGSGAYIGEGIASADLILNSVFIKNKAAFGGAVSDTKEIHYSVFFNNTAEYEGDDIYSYDGDVDYSSNWWGDNQKPGSDRIFKFLGTLTLNDWVIMTLEYVSSSEIRAGLNHIRANSSTYLLNHNMPERLVRFSVEGGSISPEIALLINGSAYANLDYDRYASDFKAYAQIDNQILDVDVRNANTRIVMEDIALKGNQNKFNLTLINVNGYRISNQNLVVEIIDKNNKSSTFTIKTDEKGFAEFNVDYPIGIYTANVKFLGNGFFDKCEASAKIEILPSITYINAYNHTYYGKNNKFQAFLTGENGIKLVNLTLTYTITDSKGNVKSVSVNTDSYGIGEVMLNLDVGQYSVKCEYLGNGWYLPSSCMVNIAIYPVRSNITAENVTLYGQGNIYNITLRDGYGTLIRGENVYVEISQGNASDKFTIKTNDDGVASLAINYLPGTYDVHVRFVGDELYGPSQASSVINVEKVLTIVSGFYHVKIPLNGLYNVVLTDMNGRRLINQSVVLNMYQGKLIKSYVANTDGNGEASFIIDLAEGNYLATMEYGGNNWYADSSSGATVIITKDAVLQNIQINASDLVQYYGEDKFFMINFNDPNAYTQYGKEILVTISSGGWQKAYSVYTDVFGLARLQINLNPGEYDVNYKYSNSYYNIFGEGFSKISVFKTPTTIFANDLIMNKKDSRIFEIFLRDVNNNPIKNMQINANIGEVKYNLTTNDEGIAKLILDLDVGEYIIKYSFDNPNYIASSSQSRILVVDSDKTPSTLISSDAIGFDSQTLNYVVNLKDSLDNGIASSQISLQLLTFEGNMVLFKSALTDEAGRASFDLDLDSGQYLVKVSFPGNNFYLGSSNTKTITIESKDNKVKTILYVGETQLSDSSKFYVVLSDMNGTLIKNASIKFMINNKQYLSKTDDMGRAYLNIGLSPNVYLIRAVFGGNEIFKESKVSAKVFISGLSTQLHAQKLVKYYRNGTQFHAILLDNDNNPLPGKTISVLLDGVYYNCTTDSKGWITLNIELKPGFYDVECYYYGSDASQNSFDKTNITVLSTVVGQDSVKYYSDSPYLNVTFLDGQGNPIKNVSFIINIDSKNYHAILNGDVFYFNLNLEPGEHIISLTNPYDGLSVAYKLTVLPTVVADSLTKVFNNGSYYVASFVDKTGKPLKNKNVDIVINGLKYVERTDSQGVVKLKMNLKPDRYLVTAINPLTNDYVENTVKVLPSIVQNKNVVMYYGSKKSYAVKIIGNDGKVASSGKIVKFNVNGKTYKVKTNKKGMASLKLKLKVGKYTITAGYNGYKVSNKITVKSLLSAKNIVVKKSKVAKFKAKLVNKNAKPLKGKKITFKIKGKSYKVKTNKKGIAVLKLKLKVGKYIVKSSYGKSRITNKIIVKK